MTKMYKTNKQALIQKINQGLMDQGWQVVGLGGSWAKAAEPLATYVEASVERHRKAEFAQIRQEVKDLLRSERERIVDLLIRHEILNEDNPGDRNLICQIERRTKGSEFLIDPQENRLHNEYARIRG